ncbi:MAG: hypothetical protein ACMUEM_01260 [Flavobacteriales bacterium AspAUS03]
MCFLSFECADLSVVKNDFFRFVDGFGDGFIDYGFVGGEFYILYASTGFDDDFVLNVFDWGG